MNHPDLPQLMLKARGKLMDHFRPILNHFRITEQQWRILRALDAHAQLEPRELGELCQISSPSMAGVLARMEETGIIGRARMAGDQRRVIVRLSAQGQQLLSQVGPLIDAQYGHIEQACGTQIFTELVDVMQRFVALNERAIQTVALP